VSPTRAVPLLPVAVAAFDYTANISLAIFAWLIPVVMNVVVIGAALGTKKHTGWTTVVVLTMLSIAPISSAAVISFWPLAGLLFPGTGWLGIGLLMLLVYHLVDFSSSPLNSLRFSACTLLTLAVLSSNAHAFTGTAPATRSIVGVDTWRGMPDETTNVLFAQAWRHEELDIAQRQQAAFVVFPESTFGEWDTQDHRILKTALPRIIGGARQWFDSTHYINVLIDAANDQVIYRQRSPVPTFLSSGSIAIAGQPINPTRISALLCVELANTGLVASTYATAKGAVIWAANLGWSSSPALHRRLVDETVLWSRLFSVPTVIAVNHPEMGDA